MNFKEKKQVDFDRELGYKICSQCKTQQDLSNFEYAKKKDYYVARCRDCSGRHTRPAHRKGELERIAGGKTCEKCNAFKDLAKFRYFKSKDVYLNMCRDCANEKYRLKWKENDNGKLRLRKYRKRPEVKARKYHLKYYYQDVEKARATARIRGKKNKKKKKAYNKEYQIKNRERLTIYRKNRWKMIKDSPILLAERNKNKKIYTKKYYQKNKKDPEFRLKLAIRSRVSSAIRSQGLKKNKRTEQIIGCPLEEFVIYIKNLWEDGMNWSNYGQKIGQWSIDHTIAIEVFNLFDINQLKAAFNYKNCRPMWTIDNFKKSDFLPNGKRAYLLSKDEKLDYLKSLGYNFPVGSG